MAQWTVDDVPKLRLTSAVLDEALRLDPPAAAFGRRPFEEIELGGYRIPKGASVFLSPYVTHRNERYFPDARTFVPERRLGAPPPRFAFFPFGGGSKMCIGEPFARTEGVLVLATIASRYRIEPTDPRPLDVNGQGLLRPDRPLLARVTPRERATAPTPAGELL